MSVLLRTNHVPYYNTGASSMESLSRKSGGIGGGKIKGHRYELLVGRPKDLGLVELTIKAKFRLIGKSPNFVKLFLSFAH